MHKNRLPLIVANWKMHGSNAWIANWLADFIDYFPEIEMVLCPPFTHIQALEMQLKRSTSAFRVGAQNVYTESLGPFTGEISVNMLTDINCTYVIVGHSERRQLFNESDEFIARKFVAAYDAGLIPILCVGETRAEREKGQTFEVIEDQLQKVLEIAGFDPFCSSVIAYEPVWAIGTGLTATPAEAEEVHKFIRGWIKKKGSEEIAASLRILYGGSVKSENAKSLFSEPNIDGGLIGGASLDPKEFFSICESAIESVKWNKLS